MIKQKSSKALNGVTIADLATKVDTNTKLIGNLAKTVDKLTQKVDSNTKSIADLTITVDKLTQRVDSNTKSIADLTKTVDDLAIMTYTGFKEARDDMNVFKKEIYSEVRNGYYDLSRRISDITVHYATADEFNGLDERVSKIEEKLSK